MRCSQHTFALHDELFKQLEHHRPKELTETETKTAISARSF